MGALDRLPTLAEVQAQRRARPNWKPSQTRLDEKVAADKDDAKLLREWARYVRLRDQGICRVCGVQTIQTLELDPKRQEIHHIVSRTNQAIRYDVRNGLCVCLRDHQRLTRHQLFVMGTAAQMYQAGRTGKWYLNGNEPLQFTTRKPSP